MTLYEWLFSMAEKPLIDNPVINGRWGLFHILTLVFCICCIVGLYFIAKCSKNREKTSRIIVAVLAALILFFEMMMRVVRFHNYYNELTFRQAMWILIPRPWCAISCWALMLSVLIDKKFFYNFASLSALLCSIMFFACPGVGFNNKIILFENFYSIATHSLLLIMSVSLITLRFTDFKYKEVWKFAICLVVIVLYSLLMIYIGFERDPMYFMPNGDIQAGILGISYGLYLPLYILFLFLYVNVFYLIAERKKIKELRLRRKNKV